MVAVNFREARASDAAAIGRVHVASWCESYVGILPDRVLDGLSAEKRSAMWRSILSDSAPGMAVFVAETSGEIIGFSACGAARDEALKEQGFDGEFGAIYVLRSHQRGGVGRSLMNLAARSLIEQGRKAGYLWVLRENLPAREFYELLGGTLIDQKVDEQLETTLIEVAYGWRDLGELTR